MAAEPRELDDYLSGALARGWWLLLLRGIAAIVFGILSWLQPQVSLAVLIIFFGAYTLVDGALGIWTAFANRSDNEHWWVLLLWGLLGLAVGLLTLFAPGLVAVALLFYIAIWAIATGVLQIIAAIRLRKEISGEWLLGLAGLVSIVFGFVLVAQPGLGLLTLVWLVASYAVVFGMVLVALALKARKFARQTAG